MNKQRQLPGPGAYNSTKDLATQMQYAKSMLGGSTAPTELIDNGNPGPGAHESLPIHTIPGFVIKP